MTLAEALLVAVGAVAAIAAVGAWWAARSSSQASAAMTAIERRRWHAPPGPTVLHLTRILVALAEQHAIRAEQATAGDADPADVELFTYQDTYDKATAGGALELLMVAYWRAQRLTAGVEALRAELTGAHAHSTSRPRTPTRWQCRQAEGRPHAMYADLHKTACRRR